MPSKRMAATPVTPEDIPLYFWAGAESRFIEYADQIVSGNLVVNPTLPVLPVEVDAIDWSDQVGATANSHSLWLHSLRPLTYLAWAFAQTGDAKYLDGASAILDSWVAYEASGDRLNRYTWYDHSVAERTENLVFLCRVEDAAGLDVARLVSLVERHAQWLTADANYVARHNHGISEDFALFEAGRFLGDVGKEELALQRLAIQLEHAFPHRAAHAENSAGYHLGLLASLHRLSQKLSDDDRPQAALIRECVAGAVEFARYLYLPSGVVNPIGDSFAPSEQSVRHIDTFGDDALLWIATDGTEGAAPNPHRAFLADGYVFLRDTRTDRPPSLSSYLSMKAGLSSTTHKHADDLSITFAARGMDVFIDPGMCSYMPGRGENEYLSGSLAHNMVSVDRWSYQIPQSAVERAGLIDFKDDGPGGLVRVRGYNRQWAGVRVDRLLLWRDEDDFVIVDDAASDSSHVYSQTFHLGGGVDVVSATPKRCVLRLGGAGLVVLDQLLPVETVDTICGPSEDLAAMSVVSAGMGAVRASRTLRFERSGASARFVTRIRVVDDTTLDLPDDCQVVDGAVIYADAGQCAVSTSHLLPCETQARFERNRVFLMPNITRMSYCYYLLEAANGALMARSEYGESGEHAFELDTTCRYVVVCYLRNATGERLRLIAGRLDYDDAWTFTPRSLSGQVPAVSPVNLKLVAPSQAVAWFEYSAVAGLDARWYVYRNGASYDYAATPSNIFGYNFTEPGEYCIVVRVRDRYYGEVGFSQTRSIVIDGRETTM